MNVVKLDNLERTSSAGTTLTLKYQTWQKFLWQIYKCVKYGKKSFTSFAAGQNFQPLSCQEPVM
jgi:hypothetical protein